MPRKARALSQLEKEINLLRPDRDKSADGWIGDKAHQNRKSDHNPNGSGVVTAADYTDDLGTLGHYVFHFLLKSRDPRVKYVIAEGWFFSSYATKNRPAWKPVPYWGYNAHKKHVHVSVVGKPNLYDDSSSWGLVESEDLVVTKEEVKRWQANLQYVLPKSSHAHRPDGVFGDSTIAWTNEFRLLWGLPDTGPRVTIYDVSKMDRTIHEMKEHGKQVVKTSTGRYRFE